MGLMRETYNINDEIVWLWKLQIISAGMMYIIPFSSIPQRDNLFRNFHLV